MKARIGPWLGVVGSHPAGRHPKFFVGQRVAYNQQLSDTGMVAAEDAACEVAQQPAHLEAQPCVLGC